MKNLRYVVIVYCTFCCALVLPNSLHAQDDKEGGGLFSFPDKFFNAVDKKSDQFEQNLSRSTNKFLSKMEKQERKLQRKLAKKDTAAAQATFGNVHQRYDSLRNVLNNPLAKLQNQYSGHLDSMKTALNFIQQQKLLAQNPELTSKVSTVFKNYGDVQGKLNQTNFIQQQLKNRQGELTEKLKSFGLGKELGKYKQSLYYYRSQMDEYKNTFEDPKKIESAILKIATKAPAFKKFFNKQSQLASLFRLPDDDDMAAEIPGLQSRAIVMQALDQRMGNSPNAQQFMSSSIANAQSSLNETKKKLSQLGNSGSDLDMPNFKPNNEKTKSLLRRLELGTNIQSAKSNSFFPVTTDIGLSLGYKFSTKATAGIGTSYKLGWGRDIRHLSFTHEGVGLRSFAEFKLKGNIWISGGAEMNFHSTFKNFDQLKNRGGWQKSALAGLSKKFKRNKLKGNVQLLFDFLYRQNYPASQPVIFRTGYSF